MANDVLIEHGNQRNCQLLAAAQCVDDELLCVAGVFLAGKSRSSQRCDSGNVLGAFVANVQVHGVCLERCAFRRKLCNPPNPPLPRMR